MRASDKAAQRTDPELALALAAAVARAGAVAEEALGGERLVHQPVDRRAEAQEPDQRAPHRQPGHEGLGAVDRIEHPDIFGVAAVGAELLADDAVGREGAPDELPHRRLAGAVGLGHRIEGAAVRLVVGGKRGAEEGQDRLAGQRRELVDERRKVDRAHGVLGVPAACGAVLYQGDALMPPGNGSGGE